MAKRGVIFKKKSVFQPGTDLAYCSLTLMRTGVSNMAELLAMNLALTVALLVLELSSSFISVTSLDYCSNPYANVWCYIFSVARICGSTLPGQSCLVTGNVRNLLKFVKAAEFRRSLQLTFERISRISSKKWEPANFETPGDIPRLCAFHDFLPACEFFFFANSCTFQISV